MTDDSEALRTAAKLAAVFEDRPSASVAEFLRLDSDLRRFADSLVPDGLRGRIDPEGVVQDAWLKLRDFGPENVEYRGPGSLASYLRRIVRQVMVDHLRTEHAVKRGGGAPHVPIAGTDTQPDLGLNTPDPTPTSNARYDELQELIREHLDETAWQVWNRRNSGASFEEIAEELGGTASSMRGVYHRARSRVAAVLDPS